MKKVHVIIPAYQQRDIEYLIKDACKKCLTARCVQFHAKGKMMGKITLKQIEKEYGISRRAIQGYEKAELVKHSDKTDHGYLLYDEAEVEKICQIRLYQRLGFQIKEIGQVLYASDEDRRALIAEKREHLVQKKDEIEELIELADGLIGKQ